LKFLLTASMFLLISVSGATAQQLECKTITGNAASGGQGNFAEATVTIAEQKPPLAPGFTVTGGGCDFSGQAGAALIVHNRAISGGWSCKGRGFNDNAAVGVTASAIVCRISK
jgi:hypothetical protein